eukprot:888105-Rhodomonas_salina.1
MSVGQQAQQQAVAIEARTNCACGKAYDPAGHHAQVCGMHGRTAWQGGHELVVHAWAELAKEANVEVDARQGHLMLQHDARCFNTTLDASTLVSTTLDAVTVMMP